MPISVLLVDDVTDMRNLLRIASERHGGLEVVGEAANGHEAVELAGRLRPDVVVLDLAMPEMDGLTAIPAIHGVSPATRILILSGFTDFVAARQAIELCAMKYMEKGCPTTEIMQAVEAVHGAPPKQRPCRSS